LNVDPFKLTKGNVLISTYRFLPTDCCGNCDTIGAAGATVIVLVEETVCIVPLLLFVPVTVISYVPTPTLLYVIGVF
jgi:hypothetical protein